MQNELSQQNELTQVSLRDAAPGTVTDSRIDVRSISKRFVLHQRGGASLSVLDRFSMMVKPSQCVALTGPSGRGKSTIVKCLYGSYSIDGGQALIQTENGAVDMRFASPQTVISLRRHHLSYVSQFLRAIPRVPTLQLVTDRLLDSADDHSSTAQHDAQEKAAEVLARLRLPESLWSLPPATFSGGEQQRVNLACCFVRYAPIVLLDEPTASLDNKNRNIVIELIQEAKASGSSVVGIFHDTYVRDAVADECIEVAA